MTDTELLSDLRVFALSAPTLRPLLADRKRICFEQLMMEFRSGKTDLLSRVAELSALDALERDIIQKINTYNTLQEKK